MTKKHKPIVAVPAPRQRPEPPDRLPCWVGETEVDGQLVTYRAHAATDPQTVAVMQELVQAAHKYMTCTHPTLTWSRAPMAFEYVVECPECRRKIAIPFKTLDTQPDDGLAGIIGEVFGQEWASRVVTRLREEKDAEPDDSRDQNDFRRFSGTVEFDCEDPTCDKTIMSGWANACITLCDDCYARWCREERKLEQK